MFSAVALWEYLVHGYAFMIWDKSGICTYGVYCNAPSRFCTSGVYLAAPDRFGLVYLIGLVCGCCQASYLAL